MKCSNKLKIVFLLSFLFCSVCLFSQTRVPLTKEERKFVKNDISKYHLLSFVNNRKYDSVIVIHYKAAVYLFAKFKDSIEVVQNISVNKISDSTGKKIINSSKVSEVVYSGALDTFIVNAPAFTSLFKVGNREQDKWSWKINPSSPQPSDENFYIETRDIVGRMDTFKIWGDWLKGYSSQIEGWQIRRLILQIFLNYNHWYKVTNMIRAGGKGLYSLHDQLSYPLYVFDGHNRFREYYGELSFYKYFPIQFVLPLNPKPNNKYPLLPARPVGATDPYYQDR